jgi:mannosylglycerate hydrolase
VVTVYVVPHTHWDREWYATFASFRRQLVDLWDELLSLTETDPDFRFLMDGQTVVIDDYLEIRPEARARLERAIRGGQIQVGPWYTLPDEFLVSGETLIRDLQRGIASAEAHGGSMRVGYLPDSFGHAAQMPQIYRQLGFRHAAVWRGVPLAIDRVAFIWQGPDGSAVLTAYMGNSYSHGVDLPVEPKALADRIDAALTAIAPFRPTSNVLLMNGNDHVLPQRALTKAVREASGRLNGTRVQLARLDDYLDTLPPDNDWPRWHGELRSSARANVLMGTLSVRAADKQRYAEAVRAVERYAEPIAALGGVDNGSALQDGWRLLLQNAAHDTACGCGIDAVAAESAERSRSALQIASRIVEHSLPTLAGDRQVWNPSPFPRQGLVEANGTLTLTPVIPGCSVADLGDTTPRQPAQAGGSVIENGHLRCELNQDGTLNALDLRSGVRFDGLHRLVDEGDAGDEYNFSPPDSNPQVAVPVRNLTWHARETGPLRASLEATFDFLVHSGLSPDRHHRGDIECNLPVRLTLSLEADTPRLDIELHVVNRATDHRLRVHFPMPFRVRESAADTPFHVTRRPVTEARRDPGASEVELPTYPMWSFVDLSDGRVGMALIADGLHEYQALRGERPELALTLLRAVGWLSRDDLKTRTGHAGPAMETPGAQVLGEHRFRYSLFFHRGNWEGAAVWRASEQALLPLVAGHGPARTISPKIELSPDCIQMTACIPRPDGFDLRILNASDTRRQARLELRPRPTRVTSLTIGGETMHEWSADTWIDLSMRPWEIATLRAVR